MVLMSLELPLLSQIQMISQLKGVKLILEVTHKESLVGLTKGNGGDSRRKDVDLSY